MRTSTWCRIPAFLLLASSLLAAGEQPATPQIPPSGSGAAQQNPAHSAGPPKASAAKRAPSPEERAWQMLESACQGDDLGKRSTAVRVLGLMHDDSRAVPLAEQSLKDKKAEVRRAGAMALAELRSPSSIPMLRSALKDDDPAVVLAAAHALVQLQDEEGFQVYYEILNGERKVKKGLIARQAAMLTNPHKLARLGFVEGLGFVPFAGIGWAAFRQYKKGDPTPIRAASAKVLANDPDPDATEALVVSAGDNHWLVRAAALEALARRGDVTAADNVAVHLIDDNDAVRFTAAAAYLELTALQRAPQAPGKK